MRRFPLAALLVVAVSGCGGQAGGASLEEQMMEAEKRTARAGGIHGDPTSVECAKSDAMNYVGDLIEAAHNCEIAYVDGFLNSVCMIENEIAGTPTYGARDGTCEALAATGWPNS